MRILLVTTALAMGFLSTPAMAQDTARADILGPDGNSVGEAVFQQGTIGAMVNIKVKGLPAGKHGLHLHTLGTCEHDHDYKTAEGHIDPSDKEHGYFNASGPEVGDLPNLYVHEDGTAQVELFLPQINVSGYGTVLLDDDGSSVMIHEGPDDHTTQPIGGSGARIACGVITADQ